MIYEYSSFLKPYIISFLKQQKETLAETTYAHFCHILQCFDNEVYSQGYTDFNFSEEQLFQWVGKLKGKKSTIASYVSCINSFFVFLQGHGFHPFLPSCPRPDDDYMAYEFSDDEIAEIMLLADNYVLCPHSQSPDKPHPKRRYWYIQYELPMFLRLLYGCGLRREEAVSLRLRDVNFQDDTLIIRKTKSHEYRIVPMDSSLANILAQYCIAIGLGMNLDAYIFPGTDFSNPIPAYCLRNHFNRIASKAGINLAGRKKHERGPCLHCLRHAFAHRSFKQGISEGWAVHDQIPWLSVYLGHRSLRETEKYLKFNSEMFAEEIEPFESYSMDLYPEVNFDA